MQDYAIIDTKLLEQQRNTSLDGLYKDYLSRLIDRESKPHRGTLEYRLGIDTEDDASDAIELWVSIYEKQDGVDYVLTSHRFMSYHVPMLLAKAVETGLAKKLLDEIKEISQKRISAIEAILLGA